MSRQMIDTFARTLDDEVRQSVYSASRTKTEKRQDSLFGDFPHADEIRRVAGLLKQHTLDHLDTYLEEAEQSLVKRGVHVHFAWDDHSAREQILSIFREAGVNRICKSKSMVTEEIHLRPFLETNGIEVVETDLGEFIVQLDDDHPSHIVTPIIHKNRRQIARTLEQHGLGAYNDDPAVITRRAREHMRGLYLNSPGTMTGANFVSAESGRLVLVTNEGNSRFGLAGARVHIAVVGIEKIVPRDEDLAFYLNLLSRSATGQQLTVYTEFINGPRREGQPDGPEEMHVVFVDNRRTEALASDCREILRCIRCGACMNVCPVFRQASGHAYRDTYPGPMGAVFAPLMAGERGFRDLADLPKASSLCGACNEVCPVDIPIPDLLLRLRNRGKKAGSPRAAADTPSLGAWAVLASQPMAWRAALSAGKVLDWIPATAVPIGPLYRWAASRTLPKWEGGEFRNWMRKHSTAAKRAEADDE